MAYTTVAKSRISQVEKSWTHTFATIHQTEPKVRKHEKLLTTAKRITCKTEVIQGDGFHPTTFGVTDWVVLSPVGHYDGARFGGYTTDEPFTNTLDGCYKYTTYASNVNTNTRIHYDANLLAHAKTRAMAKFADDNINIGAFLAESLETANYIALKAGSVFGMLRAIKKGNLSAFRKYFKRTVNGSKITPRHISKTAAERWLEWRYAVLPLISDIDGAMQLFQQGIVDARQSDRPWEIRVAASASKSHDESTVSTYYNSTSKGKTKCKCVLYAEIDDAELYAASLLGLDVKSAAWELVPFSFVLDWAVPIGTFLQACYATSGLKFSRGFWHVVSEEEFTVENINEQGTNKAVPINWGYCKSFYREPMFGFPSPSIYYKSPFSTKNVITSLALFRVLFSK